LPAVTAEELVRRSEDSWDDAEKAPLVQMEVEDLLEEQRMSGTRTGPTKKGKGKKKEEESDEEDEEDEDVVAGGPEDSDEEDEEGGEEDAMEE
jgi:translation elongation factor EF-Tu-like GTPase